MLGPLAGNLHRSITMYKFIGILERVVVRTQIRGWARRMEPCVSVVDCEDHLTSHQSMCGVRRGDAEMKHNLASILLGTFRRIPGVPAFRY